MKKKLLALTLAATMLFAAAGCAGDKKTEQNTDGTGEARKTLTIIGGEWDGTDMFQAVSWSSIQGLIADTVMAINVDTGELVPNICSKMETSADGLTVRLTFPEGMMYATGEQLEPEDFIASIEYGREVSGYADGYDNIESMEVDGRDVICHLSEYNSALDYYLGQCFIGIIDKKQLDTMSNDELLWGAVPYGAFSIDEFVAGSHVTLKPNPGYKTFNPLVENKGASYLESVKVEFTSEEFTIVTAIKEGKADIIGSLSMDTKAELQTVPDVTLSEATFPNIEFFEMNKDSKHLSDIRVRKAIVKALNREQMAEVCEGSATPAYSMIVSTVSNYSKESEDYYKENYCNDVEGAKALLKEAGYADTNGDGYVDKDGENLEFTFFTRSSGTSITIAQTMQLQLKDIGILMNIESIDWNYIYEKIAADDYDAGIETLGWGEPVLVLNSCLYDPNALEDKDAYLKLVNDGTATVNYDARTKKLAEAQKMLYDEVMCIPIYSDVEYIAYRNDVNGLVTFKDGSMYFNDVK